MKALGLLLIWAAIQEPTAPAAPTQGLSLERTVKLTTVDWLGREREIRRREVVRIKGSNVSIADVTFGERLIIRTDLKRVWKADPLGGEYSEYSFDQVAAIRKGALEEIRGAQSRVPGTAEERDLARLLEGYDQFASPPTAELQRKALANGGAELKVIVNGSRVRASFSQVEPRAEAWAGYVDALAAIGAFPPPVAEKVRELGGFATKGTLRYVLFVDRVLEEVLEVASVKVEAVPDSEFELPKGLTKVPLRGFERPPDRKPEKPAQFRRDFKEDELDRLNNPLRGEEKKDDKKGRP